MKHIIEQKQCFRNAYYMMQAHPDIYYVEGYTGMKLGDSILPIEHAWNIWHGIHFDITSELLFDGDITKGSNKYVQLEIIKNKKEAKKAMESVLRSTARIKRSKKP